MKDQEQSYPFCGESVEKRCVGRVGSMLAVRDRFPVTPLHTLVLPGRHVSDYCDLRPEERADAVSLLRVLRGEILKENPHVTRFNVGANCGASAGQTNMHVHIHSIPRRDGELDNPRGGVRGVIPKKMDHENLDH